MAYHLDVAGQARLDRYFDGIGAILGRKGRRESFALYAMGLWGEGERKSVEPIAARVSGDPGLCNAYHHRLLHFIGNAGWSDAEVREYAARYAISTMTNREAVTDWVVDEYPFTGSAAGTGRRNRLNVPDSIRRESERWTGSVAAWNASRS